MGLVFLVGVMHLRRENANPIPQYPNDLLEPSGTPLFKRNGFCPHLLFTERVCSKLPFPEVGVVTVMFSTFTLRTHRGNSQLNSALRGVPRPEHIASGHVIALPALTSARCNIVGLPGPDSSAAEVTVL